MKGYKRSDIGKVRRVNEDATTIVESSESIFAIVADGMGGHQAGDVASKLTIDSLQQLWKEKEIELLNRDETKIWLIDAIKQTNQAILDYVKDNVHLKGMGTTVVAAISTREYFIVAHIGDSRAYVLDEHSISQVTKDHSLVGELVRSGHLSEEDALFHPKKNVILKALGTDEEVEPDIYISDWNEKKLLLLCTDGLTNKITDNELYEKLSKNCTQQKIEELIHIANERGGEDNITIAVIDHQLESAGDTTC